jgi:hypothetical protein
MSRSTFSGPIRSLGGMYNQGEGSVINLPDNTNTLTLDPDLHAGRVLRTNDATLVLTLPPLTTSTGELDDPNTPSLVGVTFKVFIETTATNVKIGTNGTDKFVGSLNIGAAGLAVSMFVPGASNDFINLNGTTQGGIAGSYIEITALASLKWMVQGQVIGSGTLATPFADA